MVDHFNSYQITCLDERFRISKSSLLGVSDPPG